MGQEDLGACVMLCQRDLDELKINLGGLKLISKNKTPLMMGLFDSSTTRKLRKYVEKKARKEKADIALITTQTDFYGDIFRYSSYYYELYQYRK